MFFKKSVKFKWNKPSVLPSKNQKIVILTVDGDVYTGRYDVDAKNYKIVTMYEFISMPFVEWKYVHCWFSIEEFDKKKFV